MKKTVVVGLSGGVDSAVACYLLKQQGYHVIAVFMQNWDSYINNENYDNKKDKCDAQYEWEDAQRVAQHLDVPIHKVDFIKEYWDEVFVKFINEYKHGNTPNPDVLCNRYIKFGHLLQYAKAQFNCDYIATGHYAKVVHLADRSELHRCKDANKDQTYFLCDLQQAQLQQALFPLSDLTKKEVRTIAHDLNLPVWDKKDSTGICFIGERDFKAFLVNYLHDQNGQIVDIMTNKIVGTHNGVMYYTIGQNNGLGLGGCSSKYYVCQKDLNKKILYVVDELHKDQYLSSTMCMIKVFNWINDPIDKDRLYVRFRHRQTLIECSCKLEKGGVVINYPQTALAVTPGQYAVLYEGLNCLGGGPVTSVSNVKANSGK